MKVCPKGWHLPSNAEWEKLFRFVDGDTGTKSPYYSYTAGKHLKAASGWYKNRNSTDKYGFSAMPGGSGDSDGFAGYNGYWWTASEYDSYSAAWSRYMVYQNGFAFLSTNIKSRLLSVRCIKD
jgi:uncharacterized protein (TIGR02145 family)